MTNYSVRRNEGNGTIRVACALVFVSFTFIWLYFFQADILYVAQHELSEGQTRYDRLVGALLITLALVLVQQAVYHVIPLRRAAHSLVWFPSLLLLAVLSSVGDVDSKPFPFYTWLWLAPMLFMLWAAVVWMAGNVESYDRPAPVGLLSRRMWVNMLTMAAMIAGTAWCSNTDSVYHYRAHAEVAMLHGQYDEALRVGSRSHETDYHLMMVRMYALSKQGQLPERLFAYPVIPSSHGMLPTDDRTSLLIYPADSVFRHIGAIPSHRMEPMDYVRAVIDQGKATAAAADYLLCGMLIDHDLNGFAAELPRHYAISDSLPRYYREALVLYRHRTSDPVVKYTNPALEVDYQDFRKLMSDYPTASERRLKVAQKYADSYWYYFFFKQ